MYKLNYRTYHEMKMECMYMYVLKKKKKKKIDLLLSEI